jgi:vacuolar-type H+-ATPase subunit I/STV1
MSIVDRAAESAGIELDRDVPPPGKRRVRDWSRVIGLMRKLESREREEKDAANKRYEELSERHTKLLAKYADLEREVEKARLKDRMSEIELPRKDQKFLLTGEQVA